MEQLLSTVVVALVDNEEGVSITRVPGENADILELRVLPQDLGKVIGKQGRTARALKQILGAASRKNGGQRCELRIIDQAKDQEGSG
jgi:predicted RNA-binding protein YlqC (UPF0109 family)